jgi:hypothetical protein
MESSTAKQQPMAGGSMATAEQTYLRTELEQRRERLHEALHSPAADASLSQLLTAVDAALSRIDQGSFGLCEMCHDTIEAERLLGHRDRSPSCRARSGRTALRNRVGNRPCCRGRGRY